MKRRWRQRPDGQGQHLAYAKLTRAEYAVLKRKADEAGLTISDYVRRCINSLWLEEGDDVPLLLERRKSPREIAMGAHE